MHSACHQFFSHRKQLRSCRLKCDEKECRDRNYSALGKCPSRKWNRNTVNVPAFQERGTLPSSDKPSKRLAPKLGRINGLKAGVNKNADDPSGTPGTQTFESVRPAEFYSCNRTSRQNVRWPHRAEPYVPAAAAFFVFFSAPLACSPSFFDLRAFFSAASSI